MFDHHCTSCDKRQLIFPSQITAMANTEQGIVVSFTCWCGDEQTMTTGRAARRATKVTLAADRHPLADAGFATGRRWPRSPRRAIAIPSDGLPESCRIGGTQPPPRKAGRPVGERADMEIVAAPTSGSALQRVLDRVEESGRPPDAVPDPIHRSWERCAGAGIDPDHVAVPFEPDVERTADCRGPPDP